MKAEDTVKSYEELREYCLFTMKLPTVNEDDLKDAQIEISFNAGIREVVEWIRDNAFRGLIMPQGWKAKLKEWEV